MGSSPTGLPSIPREAGETVARHARAGKKAIGKPERKEAEKKKKNMKMKLVSGRNWQFFQLVRVGWGSPYPPPPEQKKK